MPEFDDIQSAIQTINGIENGTIDPNEITLPEDDNHIDETDPVDNPEDPTDDPEDTPEDPEEPENPEEQEEDKKVQTPEENRKFAEMRRQQEFDKKLQEELDKRLSESQEIQAARQLQEQFGLDLPTILQNLEYQRLQEQSQQTGIPIEVLQQQFQLQQQNQVSDQRLAELEYKLWQYEVRNEAEQVQKEYPMLTPDDMKQAVDYMTETLGTTNIPLKNVVMAVHGDKIMESLREQARNEVLAEKSGRKTPLQPQGGKSPSNPTLTPEERQIAQLMGVSEEDYLKYKR